jgi:hypothetical protein
MLRQEELALIKVISTHLLLKEVRMFLSRRKKKPAVPAGSRSTAPGRGAGAPLHPSREHVGKRKAN